MAKYELIITDTNSQVSILAKGDQGPQGEIGPQGPQGTAGSGANNLADLGDVDSTSTNGQALISDGDGTFSFTTIGGVSETLDSVTGRGNTTTNSISVGGLNTHSIPSGTGTLALTSDIPTVGLGYTPATTTGTVTNSAGTDATIPAATTTNAGLLTDSDKTKLDGIETEATADQTGAEIKTLYETQADTNAYNDAAVSKLSGIEASATQDQTGAEIKALYETEANAFTDAQFTKLSGIEALADVTDATNVADAGAVMDSDIGSTVQAHSTVLDNTTASYTTAEETKLSGIEALADVTDATNVADAGAVMESDTSTVNMSFVVDEDNMASNSDTKVPTQQSVKAYVDANSGSNLTVADFAGSAIVTESEGLSTSDNDTSIPTTAAVIDYVDGAGSVANDATITIEGGTGLVTTAGDFTTNQGSNETITVTHADHTTAGTVSEGGGARALAYGDAFNVPSVTYNAQGHVTSTTTTELTLPASDNTDTTYTAGDGLTLTSTDFDVDLSDTTIFSTSDASKAVVRDANGDFSAGTITASLTGNVTGTVSDVSNHDTDDITEGSTNLYYTDPRFNTAFSGKSTSDLSEGTNLYYTSARADARVAAATGVNLDLTNQDTGDLSEGTNLYYTSARADARINNAIGASVQAYSSVLGATTASYTIAEETKLSGISASADNYGSWTVSDGTNSQTITSGSTLTFADSGASSVSYNTATNTLTVSSTDTNTTYSSGNGLSLTGTTFTADLTGLTTKIGDDAASSIGQITVRPISSTSGQLRLQCEDSSADSHLFTLEGPAHSGFGGAYTWKVPQDQGTVGQALVIESVTTDSVPVATLDYADIPSIKILPAAHTSAHTLVAADSGKHISITTGGVTVNTDVFGVGDAVSIYNNSGSNQTITQGTGATLRTAGTATTGNITLAQYGICTILCVVDSAGADEFVVSGGGIS